MGFDCGMYIYPKMSIGSLKHGENYEKCSIATSLAKGYPVAEDLAAKVDPAFVEEVKSLMTLDSFGNSCLGKEVETWCSAGQYWFDELRFVLPQVKLDARYASTVYVLHKEDMPAFVGFVRKIFNKLKLDVYSPSRSIEIERDENDDPTGNWKLCRIDGVEFENADGDITRLWRNDYDMDGAVLAGQGMQTDELWSYMSLFTATLELLKVDWDNEEVVISGGW